MSFMNPVRSGLLRTFALDAEFIQGSGFSLRDAKGGEYLDFLSQYGALPFGHNPPEIWAAMTEMQSIEMPVMIQPLRSVMGEKLAALLAEVTPGDLQISTFTNSGAETVEAAIKLARVRTGRTGILSTSNGFHGKTLGALSATGKPQYQKGFAAPVAGFDYVPYGDLEALEEKLKADGKNIAAFIFEPIQGEGGVVCPPPGYVDDAIALCRKYDVLAVLDEIQTGLGRTGQLFACSGGKEVPDMLLLAKALGGGLMPIGACIVRPSAWDDRFGRLHSSTFANNNLACAAACATLEKLLADDCRLIRTVAQNGAYLRRELEQLREIYPEVVKEVRGQGYMLGIEFHRFDNRTESATMSFASLNEGVTPLFSSYLLNAHGVLTAPMFNDSHVLRIQPPLITGRQEIARAVEALSALCDTIARRDYHAIVKHLVTPERRNAEGAVESTAAEGRPGTVDGGGLDRHRFGFLIHYTEEDEIVQRDMSLGQFDEAELTAWRAWVKNLGPGLVRRIPKMQSKAGATMDGWVMAVPMLPAEMRGQARREAVSLIKEAVDKSAELGLGRMGLGAFTSVVTRGGGAVTGRGPSITSGNTLTSVMAVRAIQNVASRAGLDLANANIAVVGASGSIGRLASLLLARLTNNLTLVGNPGNPHSPQLLRRVATEVRQSRETKTPQETVPLLKPEWNLFSTPERLKVSYSTDLSSALANADVVLVATSSEITLVDPSQLRPGTIVCDVARPPNVAKADVTNNGVLVFDGGLVQPPEPINLGAFQTLPAGMCWGCLGETMLLAFEGEERDYSIGSQLTLEEADRIAMLADKHGFEPAAPQWYGEHLAEADFARFAKMLGATSTAANLSVAEQSDMTGDRWKAALRA